MAAGVANPSFSLVLRLKRHDGDAKRAMSGVRASRQPACFLNLIFVETSLVGPLADDSSSKHFTRRSLSVPDGCY